MTAINSAIKWMAVTGSILLAGCEGPFADLSTSELQERYRDCKMMGNDMSPGAGVMCGNIDKECEARRKREGRQVCF